MSRLLMTLVVAFFLVATAIGQDAEALFQQGNNRLEDRDYKGALKFFVQADKLHPNDPTVLFNLGLAANMSGDYQQGISAFSHFHRLVPDDSRGLTKLIQSYQGAHQDSKVEPLIAELRTLWKSGRLKGTPMEEERSFVREQFTVGEYQVMAFEFFQPDPKTREHTWDFCVLDPTGKNLAMYYVMEDEAASALITANGGEAPYYFDVRWADGGGTLVGVTERRPTYAEAASIVRRAMAGEKVGPMIKLP